MLKTVILISEIMATISSFVANFTLLYLIKKKTTDDLRPYSKILRQNCFVDMFFAFTIGVTLFQLDVNDGEYILLMTGIFRNIPHPYNGFLILLYVFALYFCVSSAFIPFCYRYILIVRKQKLSNKNFYFLYVLTGTLSFGILIGVYLSTWSSIDEENRKLFLDAIDDFWKDQNGSYPIFLASHLHNIALEITVLYAFILVGTTYFLITWFCIKTWKFLNKHKAQMSEKTRMLQKQLTYTLIAQALAPFVVAFLPIILILATVTFGLGITHLGVIMITMVSWVSVLNPMCVIFLVGPYRDAVLRRRKKKLPIITSQAHSSRWGLSNNSQIQQLS